jgi:hypothetical protein
MTAPTKAELARLHRARAHETRSDPETHLFLISDGPTAKAVEMTMAEYHTHEAARLAAEVRDAKR